MADRPYESYRNHQTPLPDLGPSNQQYNQPYNQQYQPPYNPQAGQAGHIPPPVYYGHSGVGSSNRPYKPGAGAAAQASQYTPYQGAPTTYATNQSGRGWWRMESNEPEIPEDKLIVPDLDVKIRHAFIRKVYGLLSVMLTITFSLAMMFNLWEPASAWIIVNFWLPILLSVLAFVAIIVITCIPSVAKRHPINVIILLFISLAFGVVLGYSSARRSTFAFALAAGITAAVTLALTLFAIQTKWDFTGCGVFVFVSVLVLMIMGIVMAFVRNKIAHIVFASIGALLFSFYLVYDTQQIVGGKHRKFQYSIDDYVFAALTLFMDVINLFMYILSIISNSES